MDGKIWYGEGIVITPNVNLIENIGFGADATHTTEVTSPYAKMRVLSLGDIVEPTSKICDVEADKYIFLKVFGGNNLVFPYNLLRPFKYIIRKIRSAMVANR